MAERVLISLEDVYLTFGGKPLFEGLRMHICEGDKICLVGKNGAGKTTLMRLIMGNLELDSGKRFAMPGMTIGYLKKFLFDPRIARDRVGTLSGGQQNRLMLAKLLTNPGNVLILDEPTNDLDMDTLDMLQELLAEYQGTLLVVSHDRDFLDRTVTEVLAFEGDTVVEGYMGGYSDYHEAKKKKLAPVIKKSSPKKSVVLPVTEEVKPKMSGKQKHELEKLPAKIAALEQEIDRLRETLLDVDLYIKNPEAFDKATRHFARAQQELEAAETRWLELEEMKRIS